MESNENKEVNKEKSADTLTKAFEEEYEEKNALTLAKGQSVFESREAYIKKRTLEFHQVINQEEKKIIEGLNAFNSKGEEIAAIFKNLEKLKGDTDSEKTYQEKLEINDEDFLKLFNLACDELDQTEYQTAAKMFNFLGWLNPRIARTWINLGLAEALQGNHTEAQLIYEASMPIFSDNPLLNLYAADNYFMMKDKTKAQEFLDKAIHLANLANDQACLQEAEKLKVRLT